MAPDHAWSTSIQILCPWQRRDQDRAPQNYYVQAKSSPMVLLTATGRQGLARHAQLNFGNPNCSRR